MRAIGIGSPDGRVVVAGRAKGRRGPGVGSGRQDRARWRGRWRVRRWGGDPSEGQGARPPREPRGVPVARRVGLGVRLRAARGRVRPRRSRRDRPRSVPPARGGAAGTVGDEARAGPLRAHVRRRRGLHPADRAACGRQRRRDDRSPRRSRPDRVAPGHPGRDAARPAHGRPAAARDLPPPARGARGGRGRDAGRRAGPDRRRSGAVSDQGDRRRGGLPGRHGAARRDRPAVPRRGPRRRHPAPHLPRRSDAGAAADAGQGGGVRARGGGDARGRGPAEAAGAHPRRRGDRSAAEGGRAGAEGDGDPRGASGRPAAAHPDRLRRSAGGQGHARWHAGCAHRRGRAGAGSGR